MNKAHRIAQAAILSSLATLLVHVEQGLYIAAHHQRQGLTDKEYRYLMARHKALCEEREKLSRLTDRLRKTS